MMFLAGEELQGANMMGSSAQLAVSVGRRIDLLILLCALDRGVAQEDAIVPESIASDSTICL